MSIYSTINFLQAEGERDGKARGLAEGTSRQLSKLLLRHGKREFGRASDEQRALVVGLADRTDVLALERIRDRFLTARSWTELLAGVAASAEPVPATHHPEYLVPLEFEPAPMPPSIDLNLSATLTSGSKVTVHMRFQRLYQPNLGAVLHEVSQRLEKQTRNPVQIVVLLLWPGADGPAVTGEYRPAKDKVFRYGVARLWEKDVDGMFDSPATAPLAALARFPPERFPEVMRRMTEVISAQDDPEAIGRCWSVAYSSMGLRYSAEEVNRALAHVMPLLREQEDVRATLSQGYYSGHADGQRDGTMEATRRWVLTLGTQKLGEPPPAIRHALETIQGLDRLEQISAKVCKAASWQEMLAMN